MNQRRPCGNPATAALLSQRRAGVTWAALLNCWGHASSSAEACSCDLLRRSNLGRSRSSHMKGSPGSGR
ncbi:hypothetical protein GQ55_1G240300 [Panicum hallii var. hallii]|uniref:Uncharacterized protein n=1 Tax=Panicum hallii var. hallii TaxID=1504633 RepID=A0A2T7F6X9_9POAL|nr:hypothetical protein GQ55_1G240300 [Panicum hallii var. hallii]